MPTKAEMAKKILVRIKALDPTENADPLDSEHVQGEIQSLYEEYKERGFFNFDLTEIPVRHQSAFYDFIAGQVAGDFGLDSQSIQMRAKTAGKRLMALASVDPDPRSEPPVDY